MIDVTHAADLREVYLYAYDAFATTPTEVASLHTSWNTRYARELLATLQQGGHIVLTEDGEGSEAWQAEPTSDHASREEVEAKIDKWLGVQPVQTATNPEGTPSSRTKVPTTPVGDPCLCGCGEATGKSNYRPGHDARHAGVVGRKIAAIMEGGHDEGQDAEISALYNTLPSALLIAKAKKVADNANRKNLAKAQPEPTCVEGIVKVGKNEYVARKWSGGTVEYLTTGPNGEWKPASKAATRTFQEG